LSIHVVTAILGVGQLAAAAVLTAFGPAAPVKPLQLILRFVIVSLGLMLASGVGLEALTHGAHAETVWFRLSFALFVVVGFLHSRVRRILRHAGESPDQDAMRRANRILWAMCLCVAAITFLMQSKPW
jgi:dipeptide/tripeptide permease